MGFISWALISTQSLCPGLDEPRRPRSEIDADASHQLTGRDELITCSTDTEHIGEARINAVLVGQVFAD